MFLVQCVHPYPDLVDFSIHLRLHQQFSPLPVTYLGYPICSSITQRSNLAFSQLYDSIKHSCFIHSQRQLSIRGRATILNTLILSKLWHVLRLAVFTKNQLYALRNLGSKFINHRIFPRLSFDTLKLPRKHGGLGVIDLLQQQASLQWRWLYPLLQPQSPSVHSINPFCFQLLQYTLNWFCSSLSFPSFHWFLLFPQCRKSFWSPHQFDSSRNKYSFLNIFNNFTTAIDILPRNFNQCQINPFTCLSLPLLEIIQFSTSVLSLSQLLDGHPSVSKLQAIDVFTYDYHLQIIKLRSHRSEFSNRPNTSRYVATLLKYGQLHLQPFFRSRCSPSSYITFLPMSSLSLHLDPSPFCTTLTAPPTTSTNSPITTSTIRLFKMLLPRTPTLTNNPLTSWSRFWSLAIPLHARTIWYRYLHHKIPHRHRLYRFFPTFINSPICQHCQNQDPFAIESTDHFLFLCPPKQATWRHTLTTYINPSLSHLADGDIFRFIKHIATFSNTDITHPNLPYSSLSIYQIFACTLLTIWSTHWNFTFKASPIISRNMNTSIAKHLARLDSDLQLDEE